MSRQIPAKTSISISDRETAEQDTVQGKVLFTTYRERDCALLIQKNRLTAVRVLSQMASKIGAIYIGRIKNMAKNIDACFVEIADGEICFLSLKKAVCPYVLNRPYDGRLVEGDTLLVQIERDAQKTKQASVTAHISLSNDYFVVSMGSPKIGYSTRLKREQRDALRKRVEYLFGEGMIAQSGELVQNWQNLLSVDSMERLETDSISTDLLPLPPTGCIVRTKAADTVTVTEKAAVADTVVVMEKAATADTVAVMDEASRTNSRQNRISTATDTTDTEDISVAVIPSVSTDVSSETEFWNGRNLLRYFFELTEQYARLLHMARYRSCYACLKEAPGVVEAALQNLAVEQEYQEIVTDNEKLYQVLSELGNSHKNARPVRLYQDNLLSLPRLYSIESKMETALGSRVWLRSGGYLIIEPTEALTVIDVNSGKYEAGKNNEEAVLTVNLEAAREVALQLRLRNLSGIIIVDFINMSHNRSKTQVMSLLRQLVSKDRIETTIVDMTPLGLVEITRKKTSKSLREQMY